MLGYNVCVSIEDNKAYGTMGRISKLTSVVRVARRVMEPGVRTLYRSRESRQILLD
jgi:hypothetical protein